MTAEDRTGIDLAVLDLAGTTVTDPGTVEASFLDALAAVGRDLTQDQLDQVRATMGQSKIVVFRALLADEGAAQRANTAFEDAFARRVAAGEIEPIPGAEAAIDELRGNGVKVCLTTGFSTGTRAVLLDHLGWGDRVDLALSPSDGVRGRPHPDLILAAVMRLEVDDVRAVAVAGDTANDLLAGHRAGASIVAGVLTGAHDRATLARAPHTHILDSVADLPRVVLGR